MACAILYQETNCQECFFDGKHLNHQELFDAANSAEILSFVVRPGCSLTRRMDGALNYPGIAPYDEPHFNYSSTVDVSNSYKYSYHSHFIYKAII
jgi:hypothetical protein